MKLANANQDYRAVLVAELMKRVKANPAYSLRRFAQQVGVSAATLSGVLSGKRRLSLKAAAKVVEKLGFAPQEADKFFRAVASGLAEGNGSHATSPAMPDYMQLADDAFQVMSDWYYYAILELTQVKGASGDPRWYARKLGINYNQANDAIERLKKLGLLESFGKSLSKTQASLASPSGVPSAAVRRRHKQILEKAALSLETHSVDERDFSAMTMAIDPALLPEAKRRITAFRRELCVFLESGKAKRVYELSMQLFPLSEQSEEKGAGK